MVVSRMVRRGRMRVMVMELGVKVLHRPHPCTFAADVT